MPSSTAAAATHDSSSSSVEAAVPSARNNNLVAESDLGVAVAAIREYFEQRSNNNNNDAPEQQLLRLQQQQLYQDCARSLTNQLNQLVQPVSDEAFHAYLARYKDDWIASADELLAQQQQLTQTTAPTLVVATQDDDDELLMDHSALARVRELRQQVREQAAAIVALRTATLDRSVALAERQLQLLWHKNDTTTTDDDESSPSNNSIFVVPEDYWTEVQQMKEAVESMNTVLQETGTKLPPKLRRFHTTLHEIDQALQQQQSQPMSQIEKAIYHRELYTTTSDDDDDYYAREGEPMEQILANLLCRD